MAGAPLQQRVDGVVASSKPLVLIDGTVVRNLRVRFEDGRAADVKADSAQDVMRTIVSRDGGGRLACSCACSCSSPAARASCR